MQEVENISHQILAYKGFLAGELSMFIVSTATYLEYIKLRKDDLIKEYFSWYEQY